jgi:hypothetical protein
MSGEGIQLARKKQILILYDYVAYDIQGVAFALAGQGRWAKSLRLDAAAREQYNKLGMEVDGLFEFWDEWIATYRVPGKRWVRTWPKVTRKKALPWDLRKQLSMPWTSKKIS